jgi:hypothetical protein
MSRGAVNGWWENVILPSSSFSNIGKSTTHRNASSSWPPGDRGSCAAHPARSPPSSTRRRPEKHIARAMPPSASMSADLRRPRRGTWRPAIAASRPSSTTIHTRPLAPAALASSVRLSARDRGKSIVPGVDAADRPSGRPGSSRRLRNPNRRRPSSRIHDLHAEAQVRLVRAEPVHRLAPGQRRERQFDLDPAHGSDCSGDHFLDRRQHVLLAPEGTFEVQLRELELAVGSEVLVPVAAGDLVVPLDPPDHQELLEELRGLRQGVEVPLAQPARHQDVTCAFGCGADEGRRLHLEEAFRDRGSGGSPPSGARPGAEVGCHRRATEVEVAVLEPDALIGVDARSSSMKGSGSAGLSTVTSVAPISTCRWAGPD